jgi:hypothetical protein
MYKYLFRNVIKHDTYYYMYKYVFSNVIKYGIILCIYTDGLFQQFLLKASTIIPKINPTLGLSSRYLSFYGIYRNFTPSQHTRVSKHSYNMFII